MPLNQGTSYIELRAKMDQLERDLRAAEAKAGTSAQRVEGRFSKAASNLGGAFRKAGPIIGTALAAGAAIGVKEIIEVEKVTAQTEARLKSTGGQANVTADDIAHLAGELQNLSAVDAEEIQSAENLLLTFTQVRNEVGKGNDVFNQATRTALDMSVALGQDLQGSVMQLGKALNDPIRGTAALRRVGVSFTEQQEKQIKTLVESGKTLEAQRLILKELQVEFGGSARAAGETLGGQMAKLKLAVEDAAGAFLLNFRPAIEGATGALTSYADLAMEAAMASERQADSFQSSKDLIIQLAHGVQEGTVSYERFKQTSDALAESQASFGEKLVGLAPGIASRSDDLHEFFIGVEEDLKNGVPIAEAWADAEEEVGDAAVEAGKKGKQAAQDFTSLFETKDDFVAWKDAAKGSLSDISGEFGELADDAVVTADELIHAFQHQIEATRDFKENLEILITRGAKPAFIRDLIDMGDQGVLWAKGLADSNKETTEEFFRTKREAGGALNSLTGLLKKNKDEGTNWANKSSENVNKVINRLEELQGLLDKGLAAPGTIRAEFPQGDPSAPGQFGSTPTGWAHQAMGAVPGFQMITSGYRPNDSGSFHAVAPPYNAVDIGGQNLGAVFANLAAGHASQVRELIFGNTIVEHGRIGYYAPNDHWDHVHLADRGAIIRGPAMIAQGNITEAHIPLTGPGAKGLALSGRMTITNWKTGEAHFEGRLKERDNWDDRMAAVRG